MFKIFAILSLAVTAFLMVSCATPYYGYSKQEWQKLSEEEKQAVQTEYEEIIQFKYRQEHEDQFDDRKHQIINRGVNAE